MLKNHGIVTAGPTIDEVVIRTIMFENAAQIQMIMEAAGDTAPEFPGERRRAASSTTSAGRSSSRSTSIIWCGAPSGGRNAAG